MTPRQYLLRYKRDQRIATGAYYPSKFASVQSGDRVAVVLLNLGGPSNRSEVGGFLYRRWMDPVLEQVRIRRGRHLIAKAGASVGAYFLWKDYEQIGGECPINRLTREQAAALQEQLNHHVAPTLGVTFRTYIAMRYGSPTSEDALRQIGSDGISRVVLLPLYPQYSIATTGSSLAYWCAMADEHAPPIPQTSAVLEYAAHPGYIRALKDRIDQALQRIPRRLRTGTHIVFAAEQPSLGGILDDEESFCGHVRETVHLVMAGREQKSFDVTYFDIPDAFADDSHPETRKTVQRLAREGARSVLIVPLGLSTDHLWTAYTLDIELRRDLAESNIKYFEVASALNCHPLFIGALADVVGVHLSGADELSDRGSSAESLASETSKDTTTSSSPLEAGKCPSCRTPVRARVWRNSSTGFSRPSL